MTLLPGSGSGNVVSATHLDVASKYISELTDLRSLLAFVCENLIECVNHSWTTPRLAGGQPRVVCSHALYYAGCWLARNGTM
jgi:hypothetical protein